MMKIIHEVAQLQQWRQAQKSTTNECTKIAFVPTMGNLHAGHLALVQQAQQLADRAVVSIFVNPIQFSPGEDYDQYPRTLASDIEKLEKAGVDVLFAPSAQILYPNGLAGHTRVTVPAFSGILCDRSRPNLLTGALTVITTLFHLIRPHYAIFGEKDYQQLRSMQRLVSDLQFDTKIVAHPIVRESSGLAMSSRNRYLSEEERKKAIALYQQLQQTAKAIEEGAVDYARLCQLSIDILISMGFVVDYFCVCEQNSLQPATPEDQRLIVLGAAYLGQTRLIDNISLIR